MVKIRDKFRVRIKERIRLSIRLMIRVCGSESRLVLWMRITIPFG